VRTYVGTFHGVEIWADDEIPVGVLIDGATFGRYVGRHRLADGALARLLTEWLSRGDWTPNDCRAHLGLPPIDAPYASKRTDAEERRPPNCRCALAPVVGEPALKEAPP
jgi:hypothetical protein